MKNLKKLREEQGITQQKLAQMIGTTQQAINGYENRGIEPDITTLEKIADCLNTSIDYLVGRTSLRAYRLEQTDFIISEDEVKLIKEYRRLPPALCEHIAGLIFGYRKRSQ